MTKLPKMIPPMPVSIFASEQAFDWRLEDDKNELLIIGMPSEPFRMTKRIDVRRIREQFERIETPIQALKFLDTTQCRWETLKPFKRDKNRFHVVRFSEVAILQQLIRDAITRPYSSWSALKKQFPPDWVVEFMKPALLFLRWEKDIPYFECDLSVDADPPLLPALGSLYQIERMQGILYRLCKREDCGNTFPFIGNSKKIYCSAKCVNIAAMREKRALEKQVKGMAKHE
jgi:hypothetical protein